MGNFKTRIQGFYFVKFNEDWVVGLFYRNRFFPLLNHWLLPGKSETFTDSDFQEIDERMFTKEIFDKLNN